MKKLYIILWVILLPLASSFYGCKKYLDINEDPNSPAAVNEQLLLPGILATFSFEVAGGSPVRVSSFWTKHLAYAVAGPHEGNYRFTGNDADNFWRYSSYTDVIKNCRNLIALANANGKPGYSAIAKIMLAWNMSYITDAFGDAPFSQASLGESDVFKPVYDKQEDIYKGIQILLDEAIAEAGQNTGAPGADDLIYNGNMSKWQKLARTLKARFYLRLSNAPGYSAVTQANLAIQALDAGAITAIDMPIMAYSADPNTENPWFQFAIDGKWSTAPKPSIYYIDLLESRFDPRLEIQVSRAVAGPDSGLFVGVTNDAAPTPLNNYSSIGPFYSAANAPQYLVKYAEVPFIRAEAEFLRANRVVTQAVRDAYEAGITASMNTYGIDSLVIVEYLISHPLSPVSNTAYQQIMEEKYIANYLQFEAYNDFRRTGFPNLPLNNEVYPGEPLEVAPEIDIIPVRFPYPSSERSYNAENIPNDVPTAFRDAMKVPVWWDN